MANELREQCRGRWQMILARLGIDERCLRNVHQPCPGCGGNDRFRFDDKDGLGTFYCGGGGDHVAGDGFTLLMHVHGWDFRTTADEVRDVLGITNDYRAPGGGTRYSKDEIDYMRIYTAVFRDNVAKGVRPTPEEQSKQRVFLQALEGSQ